MAPLGPFGADRRVAAAVSGGADSMALAVLLRQWGAPLAIVIDHGLRPASAAEAALTGTRLQAMGIPVRLVSLSVVPGPDVGARARDARYAALLDVCRAEGLIDLLTGHHAQDQAETQALRREGGSGSAGLAGMPLIGWRGDARLLRPLLTVLPGRLRATLKDAHIGWVEDPTNRDPLTARGRLRAALVPPAADIAAGAMRHRLDTAVAEELAASVAVFPTGHAEILAPLSPAAWSALIWTVSGRAYPPPSRGVGRLMVVVSRPVSDVNATLHGVRVRRGMALREDVAMAPPIPATAGAVWDGRFRLRHAVSGAELGSLGDDAPRLRRRPGLPSDVMRTLPCLRIGGKLFDVPHLPYLGGQSWPSVYIDFLPRRPLAGLAFVEV